MEMITSATIKRIKAEEYKDLLFSGMDFSGYLENNKLPGINYPVKDDNELLKKEKAAVCAAIFQSEYDWAVARYGVTRAAQEYLQGLPSCVSFPFSNYEILQWLESKLGGTIPERLECTAIEHYWQKLGMVFAVIVSRHLTK